MLFQRQPSEYWGSIRKSVAGSALAVGLLASTMGTGLAAPFAYLTRPPVSAGGGSISVIDLADWSETAAIPVGVSPSQIAASADGKSVYVGDNSFNEIRVVDAATNAVVDIHTCGGSPTTGIVVGGGYLYVTQVNANSVCRVDLATKTVTGHAMTHPAPGLRALALSADGQTLYVCRDVMEIPGEARNTADMSLLMYLPGVNEYCEYGGVLSVDGRWLYSVKYLYAVGITDTTTGQLDGGLVTFGVQPTALAVAPNGQYVYIGLSDGTVSVIDTATRAAGVAIASPLWGGLRIDELALTRDGQYLYAINRSSHEVAVIVTATNSVTYKQLSSNFGPPSHIAIGPMPATGIELVEQTRDQLAEIGSTGDQAIDGLIAEAIAAAELALDPALYEDPTHLTSAGEAVFSQTADAVSSLMSIQNASPEVASAIAAAIDAFVDAAQVLAQTAIADALSQGTASIGHYPMLASAGALSTLSDVPLLWTGILEALAPSKPIDIFLAGSPERDYQKIANANKAIVAAAAARANGQYDHAVRLYGDAWKWAQKALKK